MSLAANRLRRFPVTNTSPLLKGGTSPIDPTLQWRDYSKVKLEFLAAIQAHERQSGRQFLTWNELLEVVRTIGYESSFAY